MNMADPGDLDSADDKDPTYRDAKSLSIPAEEGDTKYPDSGQVDPDYVDAASVASVQLPDDRDAPSVRASSDSADGDFYEASEEPEEEGPAEGTGAASAAPYSPNSNGGQTDVSDKHVYFILEKEEEAEEAGGGQYKGLTLARANVSVAARARMFQETKLSPFVVNTKDTETVTASVEDQIYDIPPAFQPGIEGEAQAEASGHLQLAHEDDKSIYEITFDRDHGQGSGSQSLENSGSMEGSGVYEVVQQPPKEPVRTGIYELAKPLAVALKSDIQRHSAGSDFSGSDRYMGCLQGTPRLGPEPSIFPSKEEIEMEYNRLNFNRKDGARSTPGEAGYHTLSRDQHLDPSTNEPIYEAAFDDRDQTVESDRLSTASWGSSEFDEYSDDEEGYEAEPDTPAPTKPLPRKPKQVSGDTQRGGILNKLKSANAKSPPDCGADVDTVCLPVNINTTKHPPPELPPLPDGLTETQRKCRCVIELTISSERSYIESLDRIVQEYEKPILEVITPPKSHIRAVFKEAREILNHHKMFQIELAESVKKWDQEERIGDIFTASFSKSMLVDAYSIYVNNFAAAMDEVRTAQQSRPTFEEFLKVKEKTSYDRLSIFGLMVKPVQRFPQFIMVIQDLLKYTPHSHHDRRALQLALTELENVAHKLNERKRLSEQYFQAKQAMQMIPRQLISQFSYARSLEKPRRLIRFDDFDQIDGEMDHMKSASRRLILMNDALICVKVGFKDQDGYMMERYKLKWAAKLGDIELKDTAMTPDMRSVTKMDPGRLKALSSQLEKNEEDPFHLYAELRDMLHDLTVLGQVASLMKSLRKNYQGHGLTDELLQEVVSDLQRMIQIKDEQLRLVNSCAIILVDNSRTDKPHYVMQTPTAAKKNEWCVDFNMAKFALEKQNMPGWDRSPLAGDGDLEPLPAYFMKNLPVDVPRHYTKIKCATPVFIPSAMGVTGIGAQHLWVSSSTSTRGQVSVVSLHNTRPALTEMFKACDCDLLCSELVAGCGNVTQASRYLFSEDTVWMANVHNEIVVFPVASQAGNNTTRDPLAVVRVPGKVTSMCFVDERLFCGLDDGAVLVYSRNDAGEWCIKSGRTLMLGRAPIKCQLVADSHLWIACGQKIHVVDIDSVKIVAVQKLSADDQNPIQQMVRCGVGVWVAFHNSAVLRLFHAETMENLQEMSVASTVNRVLSGKTASVQAAGDCVVTCLATSTGLLWIGTSLGLVLTLPLPRLSDGVPLYRGHPSVSCHGHRGPVRFIIPVRCSGSIMELYKSSSLRSSLRARPSLRNRKRERLEMEGATVADEKLLSSGADLDSSQQAEKARGKQPAEYMEVLPPQPHEMPKAKKEGSKLSRHLKALKNSGFSRSGSLGGYGRLGNPVKRPRVKTLSFRSELANRIKRTTLSRHQMQAQSMFDLRQDDGCEVEMFYENLLDAGDVSDDEESVQMMALDDFSIRSESSLALVGASGDVSGSQNRLGKVADPIVPSLDLADICEVNTSKSNSSSSTNESIANLASRERSASDVVPPTTTTQPSSVQREASFPATPPPSPRISMIRANTMRKTSASNAVMVLSGGDGYVDLNTSSSATRNEDATLLLWIYKF